MTLFVGVTRDRGEACRGGSLRLLRGKVDYDASINGIALTLAG